MSRVECADLVEQWEELLPQLTPSDVSYIETLTSPKRRREVASWRALLRSVLCEMGFVNETVSDVEYHSNGAPYIANSHLHISVSHSSSTVAVMVSGRERCALDIESLGRDFAKVAARYTTPEEESLFLGYHTVGYARALIWSAKETLYKVGGFEGIDLIRDIVIERYRDGAILGSINGCRHTLRHFETEGQVVVYTYLAGDEV